MPHGAQNSPQHTAPATPRGPGPQHGDRRDPTTPATLEFHRAAQAHARKEAPLRSDLTSSLHRETSCGAQGEEVDPTIPSESGGKNAENVLSQRVSLWDPTIQKLYIVTL